MPWNQLTCFGLTASLTAILATSSACSKSGDSDCINGMLPASTIDTSELQVVEDGPITYFEHPTLKFRFRHPGPGFARNQQLEEIARPSGPAPPVRQRQYAGPGGVVSLSLARPCTIERKGFEGLVNGQLTGFQKVLERAGKKVRVLENTQSFEDRRAHLHVLIDEQGHARFDTWVSGDSQNQHLVVLHTLSPGSDQLAFVSQSVQNSPTRLPLANPTASAWKPIAIGQKEACDQGSLEGCHELGLLHETGQLGVSQDYAQAVLLYKKACYGGIGSACTSLATLHEEGNGVAQDSAKAQSLYKRALGHFQESCTGGDGFDCAMAGNAFLTGRGVDEDLVQASELNKRACDLDVGQGCAVLALMYQMGEPAAPDPTVIADLYRKAAKLLIKQCNGDEPGACRELAMMYHKGLGVEKDLETTLILNERACKGGDALACAKLNPAASP